MYSAISSIKEVGSVAATKIHGNSEHSRHCIIPFYTQQHGNDSSTVRKTCTLK